MAKTIKFNLICNEKPIRTIEDLQNNFVIEDVLDLYRNKLLERWLDVRGYKIELNLVSKIKSDKPIEVIKDLIQIFNVESNLQKVEEYIYIYEYKEQRARDFAIFKNNIVNEMDNVIGQVGRYNELVSTIFNNPDDAPIIKACIQDIIRYYYPIFELNHRELFYKLLKTSKLAVLCLLMYDKTRKFYLHNSYEDYDKKCMYNSMCQELRKVLSENNDLNGNVRSYKKLDKGYWGGVTDKPCMVLSVSERDREIVREKGKLDIEYKYSNLRPQADFTFPIFHMGLEHTVTSDCYNPNLLYMEI